MEELLSATKRVFLQTGKTAGRELKTQDYILNRDLKPLDM